MAIGTYIPRYELFAKTQNILSGSTIASALVGTITNTSHHNNIIIQYGRIRMKCPIASGFVITTVLTVFICVEL